MYSISFLPCPKDCANTKLGFRLGVKCNLDKFVCSVNSIRYHVIKPQKCGVIIVSL